MEQAPHATDTAVFYLRGLEKLNGSPVKTEMRVSADKRYQQGGVVITKKERNLKEKIKISSDIKTMNS